MNYKLFVARFLCALGLGVWIGGIAFAGMSAPTLFHITADNGVGAVAPQVFGKMLQNFQFLAGACAVFALLGWALDRPLAARGRALWNTQGALTALMLLITLYMGLVMLPRMNTLQRDFLPQLQVPAGTKPQNLDLPKPQPGNPVSDEFERSHHLSTFLVQVVMIMGLLALGTFAARTAQVETQGNEQQVRVKRDELVAA